MRMVLTEYLTDNTGRLLGLCSMAESESVDTVKHTSMYRFESVPHIWQGSRNNDRHRVVDIRTPHLLVNVDLFDPAGLYFCFFHMSEYSFIQKFISWQRYTFSANNFV